MSESEEARSVRGRGERPTGERGLGGEDRNTHTVWHGGLLAQQSGALSGKGGGHGPRSSFFREREEAVKMEVFRELVMLTSSDLLAARVRQALPDVPLRVVHPDDLAALTFSHDAW